MLLNFFQLFYVTPHSANDKFDILKSPKCVPDEIDICRFSDVRTKQADFYKQHLRFKKSKSEQNNTPNNFSTSENEFSIKISKLFFGSIFIDIAQSDVLQMPSNVVS